jgi:carbamoylphosphate synthase large subunit
LSPALLRSLRVSNYFDYFLIGIDSNPKVERLQASIPFVDSFHVVPKGTSTDYQDIICDLVQQHSIEFILPGSDDEALALASCEARLADLGASLLISKFDTLSTIADKARTYQRLQKDKIAVPDFCLVNNEESFFQAIGEFGFPKATIVCKPSSGRGNRGVHILEGHTPPPHWLGAGQRESRISPADLPQHPLLQDLTQGYLIMPRLYTPAYDADIFPTFNGSPAAIVRQRVNPAGIPFDGNIFTQSEEAVEYCRAIAKSLSLEGIHDIDLMTGRDGTLRLLEVNPRPSGSMAVSLFSGVPIVDIVIGNFLEIEINFQEPASGAKVWPHDLRTTIEDLV